MRWLRVLVLATGVAMPASRLDAQQATRLTDRLQVTLSAATVAIGSTVRVDTDSTDGTELDTEDDLGVEGVVLRPRVAVRWRPWRRHEFEATYLFVTRSGYRVSDRDLTIDTLTFEAGAELDTRVGSDQLMLNWRWTLRERATSLIGTSAGVGLTFFDWRVTGTGTITGPNGSVTDSASRSRSVPGPAAALGVFGRWQAGERWYVEGDVRGLYVAVDGVSAAVFDANAAVRYFATAWLGLELGYGLTVQRVNIEKLGGLFGLAEFVGTVRYATQNARLGVVLVP